MEAKQTNLLTLLKRSETQFIIPIYQRTYSWTHEQCRQLWADILRLVENSELTHFVGSVVYIADGHQTATDVAKYLLIDGQQRLTTISLLLVALAKLSSNTDQRVSSTKIYHNYLINPQETDDLRFKLILTQHDKHTHKALVNGEELPKNSSVRIVSNYRYFENLLTSTQVPLDEIFDALGRMVIVDVALEREKDNPQLIFESMNSTGLDLAQADLIRNYLLMGLDSKKQKELYERFWFPMEQQFGTKYITHFDRFMRDYLTVKQDGKIPNIGHVYAAFKLFTHLEKHNGATIDEVVEDISRFAKYYTHITFTTDKSGLDEIFVNLQELKVEVATPFLMKVYHDFQHGNLLSYEEFTIILRLVESYVLRRIIVGIPTNSLNKTFAKLIQDIDESNYLQSIKHSFMSQTSYRRFPRDAEFKNSLITKDIYNVRIPAYILGKLENHQRGKEKITPRSYTIEHIMPQNQNLSREWQNMLGKNWREIQEKYLHTIGNLTLTGYNSEMSDRSFDEKRDMEKGFARSPLYLNEGISQLSMWGEAQIIERAEKWATIACSTWAIPEEIPQAYQKEESAYTLESYQHLQGEMLLLYEELHNKILDLDTSIRREFKKEWIAYKTSTNFVDIIPQKRRLQLVINMKFDEIDDPKDVCENVTDKNHWGNGDARFNISTPQEIENAMYLILQSFQNLDEDYF